MKIWFLRFTPGDLPISIEQLRRTKAVPVLFKELPIAECSLDFSEENLRTLVEKHYGASSTGTRGQVFGALWRFFHEVQVEDLLAVRLNRDPKLLFGEVLEGPLKEFPGIKESKGRPVRWLSDKETDTLNIDSLPQQKLKYRGTICLWADVDVPDEDEQQKVTFYTEPHGDLRQIKFIRVGADYGCGGRLSRLFADGHYHFIPIPKHNDPEFCRYTYGDGNRATKFRSLLTLRKNDILGLYAGFETEGVPKWRRVVGVFAYFVVRELYLFDRREQAQRALRVALLDRSASPIRDFKRLANRDAFEELIDYCGEYNEHAGIEEREDLQMIICGQRKSSRLLQRVEILADANAAGKYIITERAANRWGLKPDADLTRCSVRTVAASDVDRVAKQLEELP